MKTYKKRLFLHQIRKTKQMRKISSVEELIPQRAPFVFIDRTCKVTRSSLHSLFEIKEGSLLCENGVLREAGIMENIAQSAAAHIGYFSEEETRIGVIGSVKDFQVFTLPKVGEVLHTHVQIVNEVFKITLLKAEVKVKKQLIASCEMKVALP